jgi:purine-binding chemotaxis protein CheW
METQAYLIFRLHDSQYGIAASQVREIFQLPELTPIAEAPGDIIGILNLRGRILPVMHLARRLGQPISALRLSDTVIVLDWQGLQVGMVVDQVYTVQTIDPADIEANFSYGRDNPIHTAFMSGVAQIDADMIVLLNPETLIRQSDQVATLIGETVHDHTETALTSNPDQVTVRATQPTPAMPQKDDDSGDLEDLRVDPLLSNFYQAYWAQITPEERQIFRQRADDLRLTFADPDSTEQVPLAVIGLGDEYFALDLGIVREFINIRSVTPLPCCPQHIVGNMNLRGEVMTLVDIRTALHLPVATNKTAAKAIVVEVDDVIAGITVDGVFDVMYMPASEITAIPSALPINRRDYCQGTAFYQENLLSILDLPKMLTQEVLRVNQVT